MVRQNGYDVAQFVHVRVIVALVERLIQQTGLQAGSNEILHMPAADVGIFVFALNDFPLLGQSDLAIHRARWLRQDCIIC